MLEWPIEQANVFQTKLFRLALDAIADWSLRVYRRHDQQQEIDRASQISSDYLHHVNLVNPEILSNFLTGFTRFSGLTRLQKPFFVCHSQAELIIVDRSACCGCQPRTDRAFEESATRCEGSPARRPSISIGISCCVTSRAALMTSSTEYPCPLPRLIAVDRPPLRK